MIRIIKHLLKSIALTPLNLVMLPIALCTITIKSLIRRFQVVEADLQSVIPVTIRRIKLLIKDIKKK